MSIWANLGFRSRHLLQYRRFFFWNVCMLVIMLKWKTSITHNSLKRVIRFVMTCFCANLTFFLLYREINVALNIFLKQEERRDILKQNIKMTSMYRISFDDIQTRIYIEGCGHTGRSNKGITDICIRCTNTGKNIKQICYKSISGPQ